MKKYYDFLGNELSVGDECIRPTKLSQTPVFKKCEIISFHDEKGIEILSEGNTRTGFTYGSKLLKVKNKFTLYCIEIDRGGIGEEDMVIHEHFEREPTREEVLKVIEELDCGYDDNYCKFEYYKL